MIKNMLKALFILCCAKFALANFAPTFIRDSYDRSEQNRQLSTLASILSRDLSQRELQDLLGIFSPAGDAVRTLTNEHHILKRALQESEHDVTREENSAADDNNGVTSSDDFTDDVDDSIDIVKASPARSESNISTVDKTFQEFQFLRQHVRPVHYELYLYPDLETGVLQGVANITIDISEECTNVTGHQQGLNFSESSLRFANSEKEIPVELMAEYGFWSLNANSSLKVGRYVIHMEYTASLSAPDYHFGLFVITNNGPKGKIR